MGIQKDAGELLLCIYNGYTKTQSGMMMGGKIGEITNWERGRIYRAIRYLSDKEFIIVQFYLGGDFIIRRLL